MNRQRLAVVAGLGLVVVALGLAFAGGLGPFSDDDDGGIDDFPTATDTPTSDAGDGGTSTGGDDGPGGGDTTAESTPQRPFDLRIDSVESCGQTCRDVTATLVNQQDRRATGTTVYTRIHVGNGTDGDVVWEGNHEVGALDAGGSDTETQRVELSYFDALAVQREDGWVTIVTSVETDRQTVTFRERRDVT